jgi:hypothetical protein
MADRQTGPTVYTALIMPLSSHASFPKPQPPGQPGQPPRPDNTLPGDLPRPAHPIFLPLPPGAPVDPDYGIEEGAHPDQGLPGQQPKPDNTLPGQQPKPDNTLPGQQPQPSHPIVLPPDQGGWGPIYIWGGGPGARPPIALPPEGQQPEGKVEWKAIWTPSNGWQTIGVVVPGEGKPMPTPSQQQQK